MATQGPLSPGTVVNDTGVGTVAWSSPGNATASDNVRASASVPTTASSNYLKATNFGFTLPAGAIINGIKLEIEKQAVSLDVLDNRIRLVKGGVIGTVDRNNGSAWPGTDTYVTHGSSSDLWGDTWTASDINDTGFGFAASCTNNDAITISCLIDHGRITITYTPGSTISLLKRRRHHVPLEEAMVWLPKRRKMMGPTKSGPCSAAAVTKGQPSHALDPFFLEPLQTPLLNQELGAFRDEIQRMISPWVMKKTTGTVTVSGLSVGRCEKLYVSHSSCVKFAMAEYPRVTTTSTGFAAKILAHADIGGTLRTTDGSGFVLLVENVSHAYTAGENSNISFTWERHGVAA